jgi:translocation and assembly module TamB
MHRVGRAVLAAVTVIAALVLVAAVMLFVLTGTDWGRERVRRYAQQALQSKAHGRVRIGKLTGNLLTGVTVHDFSITDSAGKPFIAVQSVTGTYSIVSLLEKRIWIKNAVLVRPLIVLDKPPSGKWNWQLIFPHDTTPKPPSQQTGWGDWVRFNDLQVLRGQLIVRTAWSPSARLAPAARDSALRDALAGKSRLMIQRVPGGYEKVIELDTLNARIPLLRLAEPGYENRLARVAGLQMVAYPFRPPPAVVRTIVGDFPFNNDSLWWNNIYAALPHSRITGDGSYQFNTGDLTMSLHANPVDFADVRWIYPRLPGDGHGSADLRLTWRGAVQDYTASNVSVAMQGATAQGKLGIKLGDSITIHDTNLRFAHVDTRLLEQLIPHFSSPRRGVLTGHAAVSGGRQALHVNGDVAFADQRAGTSRIGAVGEIGFLPSGGVRAVGLRLDLHPAQVELARTFDPTLPISGVVTGTATLNGSTRSHLDIAANITHVDRGARSHLSGTATVQLASGGRGTPYLRVDAEAAPVSLVEAGRFFPSVGLIGSASGAIHARGSLSNLRFSTDLRLPDDGRLVAQGSANLKSPAKSYDVRMGLTTVNLSSVLARAPATSLTANVAARGTGFTPATMNAALSADLASSSYDSIAVDRASVRARLAGGLLHLDDFSATGAYTRIAAAGTFGLTRARRGTIRYVISADSLGAFNRWIPRSASDTGATQPRPRVMLRAVQRARADSTRVARATEVQRFITGAPPPTLHVHAPTAVPRDTVAGSLYAKGTLSGNLYDMSLVGAAGGTGIIVRGNSVHQFTAQYALMNLRTSHAKVIAAVKADTVSAFGFAFDSVYANVADGVPHGPGTAEILVKQSDKRVYSARGDFVLNTGASQVRFADLQFHFDTAAWIAPHPMTVQWGGPGIRVTNFELRNGTTGRLYANGLLPTKGVSDFTLDVDNFPVENVVDLAQTDIEASGLITIHGRMTGTLSNPAFRGAFGMVKGTYNGATVPQLLGTFGYAGEELSTHVEALRPGQATMATLDGTFPLNLALTGVTGSRLLPRAMAVNISGDSLPVDMIPAFTDVVENISGHVAGQISMRGTMRRPEIAGGLVIRNASGTITQLGSPINDINGAVRVVNDTVFVDSLVGYNKGPIRLRGTLAVGSWREPSFNLYLVTQGAQVMDNKFGKVRADAGLALTGPFTGAYLSGQVNILDGVIQAPEPTGRHVVGAGDPALAQVLDTTVTSDRVLFPPQSKLLADMRIEVTMNIHHNTWVRNREANVEIYTDYPIYVRSEGEALSLTGSVTTDRGEYKFLSKRFQIQRGSALFIGGPTLDPTLQITGEYAVQVPTRGTVNIKVVIAGTLHAPKLSLESDAQPPMTQSELLSYLAFGRSTTELFANAGSSITGAPSGGDIFGIGAELAVRRLAAVALGVAVDQVESSAGKALGADVLDITPADVPTAVVQGQGLGNFLKQTQITVGKYINPRTFMSVQELSGKPGLQLEHRTADGWRFDANFAPRLLLLEPTLSSQGFFAATAYGGFIIREWRF